jgi:uncharacterized protein YbgA (DUF1722 family)
VTHTRPPKRTALANSLNLYRIGRFLLVVTFSCHFSFFVKFPSWIMNYTEYRKKCNYCMQTAAAGRYVTILTEGMGESVQPAERGLKTPTP